MSLHDQVVISALLLLLYNLLLLAHQAQLLFHMQTTSIWMRHRVTRYLTQIQAV